MLSLIKSKLRLLGSREFDIDAAMKIPSLAFHWHVNQGGHSIIAIEGEKLNFFAWLEKIFKIFGSCQ